MKPPTRYAVYVLHALALHPWDVSRKDIPKSRSPPSPGQHLTFTYPDVLPILVLSIAAQLKKNMLSFWDCIYQSTTTSSTKIKMINKYATNCPGACVGEKKCSLSQKNLNIIYKNIQNLFKNNPEVKIFQTTTQWMDFRKYVPPKRCRKGSIDHYVSRILLHSILIWGLPSSIL